MSKFKPLLFALLGFFAAVGVLSLTRIGPAQAQGRDSSKAALRTKTVPLCGMQDSSVTALLSAAKRGDNAKIQTLIRQGVDINAIDSGMGFTALMLAAQMNHLATVKLLLDKGALVDSPNPYTGHAATPLQLASYGWANILGGAVSPVQKEPKTRTNAESWQKAMLKWRHGYFNIIKLLIERGADVKVRGSDGSTPLLHAAYGCDAQTLQLLLEHGADVNAATSGRDGILTPLMNAAILPWPDSADKVKLLLAWGANISAKNEKGDTALSLTRQMRQKDVVKVLEAELARRNAAGLTRSRYFSLAM